MRKVSNAEVSLEDILDYEKIRYKRKGYGLVFAVTITIIWFLVLPKLAYLVWPYKIENEGTFYSLFSYILHQSFFIFDNLVMVVIYKAELPFFERYKIHDKAWPWKEDPVAWNKLLKETISLLFFNQVILMPCLFIPWYLTNSSPFRMDYESLPSSFEVIWQTVFFMLVDDFMFYWMHRFLHGDRIYPYIHKVHHKYQNSISISSEYAHPIEFLLVNAFTSNAGSMITGKKTHYFTILMWYILRTAETTDGHCGYEFSWSPYRLLPMSGSSEYHNYHHLSFKGNYSSWFTYMDRLCGTINVKYQEFVEKKREYSNRVNTLGKTKESEVQKKNENDGNGNVKVKGE